MKGLLALLVLIFFFGCVSNQPVACTADAKMCPDGSWVGRVLPLCEFAPCQSSSNLSMEIPDNYVASESTVPSSVSQKYDDLLSQTQYGGTLSFCRSGNEGFYFVAISQGDWGMSYYYSISGIELWKNWKGDIVDPSDPAPLIDVSKYTCTIIKKDYGDPL